MGTSSLRRSCQLKAQRPDLVIKDLRGNVNTRLRKLDAGEYDAIILASAGLIRLNMAERIRSHMATDISLPAGGQGAMGIECRTHDDDVLALLAPLQHNDTALCVRAERAVNKRLNGGCQAPIACHAMLEGDELYLRGLVGSLDGRHIIESDLRGPAQDADQLGTQLAEILLSKGADTILNAIQG